MLDRLHDRATIADQMYRYARATDWCETDMHRDVFTPDCVFASPHTGDMHGVESVVDWMQRVLPRFEATQHMIGNIAIDFTSETEARTRQRGRPHRSLRIGQAGTRGGRLLNAPRLQRRPQRLLVDLSHRVSGDLVDEAELLRALVTGQGLATPRQQFIG